MRTFCIYGYTRERDSELDQKGTYYYIGKGLRRRARSPQHNVPVPKDSIRIVTLLDGMSEEYAFEVEALLISLLGRADLGTGTLRNRTDGGQGSSGYRHTEEAKRKISMRLANPSSETTAKRIVAHKGMKHSEEARERMRAAKRNISEETRAKMRAGRKSPNVVGKKRSEATRAKMSLARKRWWMNKSAKVNYNILN